MSKYRVYVSGRGAYLPDPIPRLDELPIAVVTLGRFGSTVSDSVANRLIYKTFTADEILAQMNNGQLIYWTRDQWRDWALNYRLNYLQPSLYRHQYQSICHNLALYGDKNMGPCGVCFCNEASNRLIWLFELDHGKRVTLSNILLELRSMLCSEDNMELFWTACMQPRSWQGGSRKISFNPIFKLEPIQQTL